MSQIGKSTWGMGKRVIKPSDFGGSGMGGNWEHPGSYHTP